MELSTSREEEIKRHFKLISYFYRCSKCLKILPKELILLICDFSEREYIPIFSNKYKGTAIELLEDGLLAYNPNGKQTVRCENPFPNYQKASITFKWIQRRSPGKSMQSLETKECDKSRFKAKVNF